MINKETLIVNHYSPSFPSELTAQVLEIMETNDCNKHCSRKLQNNDEICFIVCSNGVILWWHSFCKKGPLKRLPRGKYLTFKKRK